MNPAIILALVLSTAHYFSDIFKKFFKKFHPQTVSFSAGFFISFMFLELFPQIIEGSAHINVFLLILLGFSLFHLMEKYVYQHVIDKHRHLKKLKELHMVGFFIDHFIIGFILILTIKLPGLASILIFIPLALHTISSSMSLESIHRISKTKFNKILLSASTTIGALVALFIVPFGVLYYGLFALFLGALMYVVIRDILPRKAGGQPLFFIIGVFLNLILLNLALII